MLGKKEVILKSKGRYQETCTKNSALAHKMLLNIRDAIKLMSKIRDISSTEEIISGIALCSKSSSDAITKVFDLVEQLEEDTFVDLLGQRTKEAKNLLADLTHSVNRCKDYINTDILGIVVLSE